MFWIVGQTYNDHYGLKETVTGIFSQFSAECKSVVDLSIIKIIVCSVRSVLLTHWSARILTPPGGFNLVVGRDQQRKNVMLAVINKCQNTQCSLQCPCFALLAWSEICICVVLRVCVSKLNPNLFFTSLFVSLCVSQPRGRAGGRVCCFRAGRGAEVRRTVTHGTVLSDMHSLALPHAHWRSDTHCTKHTHAEEENTHIHIHKMTKHNLIGLRLKNSYLTIRNPDSFQLQRQKNLKWEKCVMLEGKWESIIFSLLLRVLLSRRGQR